MNDPTLLRRYRATDAEAVRAVFLRAVRRTASSDYSAEQIEAWAPLGGDRARWIRERFDANTWVAERHGRVVGFTDFDADRGRIGMLFVDPDTSRCGIGSKLVARNIDEARKMALGEVTVESSITARPLFERYGFTVVKRQRVVRRNTVIRNYLMRRGVEGAVERTGIRENLHIRLRDSTGPAEYPDLVAIWRSAVHATHHFVLQDDLADIEALLPSVYLPSVRITVAEFAGEPVGFSGTAAGSLEMLFVHDGYRSQGIGSILLENAVSAEGVGRLDVNDQNSEAVSFYRARGFVIVGGSALDGAGRPYPTLHMARHAEGFRR